MTVTTIRIPQGIAHQQQAVPCLGQRAALPVSRCLSRVVRYV
jgi:hypothetical protein